MPAYDEKHVKMFEGIVVYDGVTKPNLIDDKDPSKGYVRNLKVAFQPHNPDVAVAEQYANKALQESEFRGVLPAGGLMPVGTVGAHEFGGQLTGYKIINFKTYNQPDVYDENGAALDPMAYGPLIYQGQKVVVLGHFKSYNNKSKGIKAMLDGFQIITSAQAPKKQFSGSGIDTSKAFGNTISPADNPSQGAIPPAAPPADVPAAPPLAPPVEQSYYHPNGTVYTESALRAAGFTDAHFATMRKA